MPRPSLKEAAKRMRTEVHALYLALGDPRVPRRAKLLAALVMGYALCPIDLIPDFIPVLGQLDDLIIVPAGISLVVKMIPEDILRECRRRVTEEPIRTRTKWIIAPLIILIWGLFLYLILRLIWPFLL